MTLHLFHSLQQLEIQKLSIFNSKKKTVIVRQITDSTSKKSTSDLFTYIRSWKRLQSIPLFEELYYNVLMQIAERIFLKQLFSLKTEIPKLGTNSVLQK